METSRRIPDRAAATLLFLFVFLAHGLSPSATSADSHWIVPQMISIVAEGDSTLDEYPALLRLHKYQGVDCVDDARRLAPSNPAFGCPPGSHYYFHYPVGATVLALPVFVAMDSALRVAGPLIVPAIEGRLTPVITAFFRRDYLECHALVEMVIASFLMACATVLVFVTARLYLPLRRALLVALLFAFGTAAWSTGSRALWQHGPEMLMLAAAVYILVLGQRRPALLPWSAVPLAIAYFVRPTAAAAIVCIGAYLLFHRRGYLLKWSLLGCAAAAPFALYYYSIYGRPVPPYFTQQGLLPFALSSVRPFLSALAGHCFSPSRGLFVFSPVLLFSVAGMVMAVRKRWNAPLAGYLAAAAVLHWVVISIYADWTAGYCFGPRYFSEMTPVFTFFLIPVAAAYAPGRTPRAIVAVFALFAAFSVFVHMRGAAVWAVQDWNTPGVSAARAWDWRDPQFLRGLLR